MAVNTRNVNEHPLLRRRPAHLHELVIPLLRGLVPLELRANHPEQRRPQLEEVAIECAVETALHLGVRDVRMMPVLRGLPVNVRPGEPLLELAGVLHALPERGARHCHVEHELVVGAPEREGMIHFPVQILRSLVLEAENGRAQHLDTMRLQLIHQVAQVQPVDLLVRGPRRFLESDPHESSSRA